MWNQAYWILPNYTKKGSKMGLVISNWFRRCISGQMPYSNAMSCTYKTITCKWCEENWSSKNDSGKRKLCSPKLINCYHSETISKCIKIPEKEALRSTISMHHHQRRRPFFAIKRNRINKPRLVASRSKPPDFRTGWTRPDIDLLLLVRSSANVQSKVNIKLGL